MRIDPKRGLFPVVVLAIAGLGCGDSSGDSLLSNKYSRAGAAGGSGGGPTAATTGSGGAGTGGGSGGTNGGGSGGGASSPTASSTSLDGGAAASDGGAAAGARAMFEALLPGFDTACGGACHAQGGANAPAYLGGADPYATIKTFTGMVTANPAASLLLTKGVHEGPAFVDPLKTSVTQWLTVEAATIAASGPPTTAPIAVAAGANTVDLSKVGVAGASLEFTAAISGNILTLSALTITAPAATGLHATYPIFYLTAPGGTQTENDDLSNDDQTVAAGASAPLGTGLLILTGWASGDTLEIAFTKLAPATVADAGASGGCKSVASFTANAVPAIQANQCLNCHNTGGSGNASLDLSALAASPVNDAVACAQALTRINPASPAQSDIILAPTGQVGAHPFKGASANYTTMMETWISAEK